MSVDPHITAAFKRYGGPVRDWQGAHRDAPPAFVGHPAGVVDDVPMPKPLFDLVDVEEGPPSLAAQVAAHAEQLANLDGRVSALEGYGPWND